MKVLGSTIAGTASFVGRPFLYNLFIKWHFELPTAGFIPSVFSFSTGHTVESVILRTKRP